MRSRRLLAVLPLTLALAGTVAIHAPVAAGEASCAVTNLTTPSGIIGGLQTAVDLADPGDTLQVKGTCHFGTVIDKRIKIVGAPSETLGSPTLDGQSTHRVLWIKQGRTVSITGLTVDFGMAPPSGERAGGGILNDGTLTLKRVSVNNGNADVGGGVMNNGTLTVVDSGFYGNEAETGAGIANLGTLILKGTTELTTNFGTYGGGIWSWGDVTISGSVAIHDNEVDGMGGGIYMSDDPTDRKPTLRMSGTSTVRDNTAALGGGIFLGGAVAILDDSVAVRTNQAAVGGGVYLGYGRLTLNDKTSVRGNRASEAAAGIETQAQLGKAFIKMTGRSSVKGNVAAGQTAAIRLIGSLLMEDNAVIRDNVDQGGYAAITTVALPDRPVTITMRDNSLVTSHALAPGGAAVWKVTGCGTTTFVGVKTRVVGNTPKNITSSVGDC